MAALAAAVMEPVIEAQHRRDDARRAVGGGGDHAPAGGVLLVHRQGPEVDPVHGGQGVGDLAFDLGDDRGVQLLRPSLDVQAAGQAPALAQPPVDTGFHGREDGVEARLHVAVGTKGAFVGGHQACDGQARALRHRQQAFAGVEGIGHRRRNIVGTVAADLLFIADEAAADGEVAAPGHFGAGRVEGGEDQGVGVLLQPLSPSPDDVPLRIEGDVGVRAQPQAPARRDGLQRRLPGVGVHGGRSIARQAQDHRPVRAVAPAGEGEGGVELDLHPGDVAKPPHGLEPFDEPARGGHRAHGVAARRADSELEQVEDADGGHKDSWNVTWRHVGLAQPRRVHDQSGAARMQRGAPSVTRMLALRPTPGRK